MLINTKYEIEIADGKFVDFHGIKKESKNEFLRITLENGNHIDCSTDHIFIVGNKNITANSLSIDGGYLSTIDGDYYITNIEHIQGDVELFDIVESGDDFFYVSNGIINHNCSFLGSGDNFISEEYLQRIEEKEIQVPLRQEYMDFNMWIYEDPIDTEEYVMILDVSSGHGEDFSTINILKKITTYEEKTITKNNKTKKVNIPKNKVYQVAEYYGKVKPNELGEIAYVYGKKYNNAFCVIDITGGYGTNTIERLIEIGYDNIYYSEISHKPTRDKLYGYIKQGKKTLPDGSIVDVDLVPGFYIAQNRGSILIELQRSINLSDCVIRSSRLLTELKTFVTVGGSRVADHKRTFHDDSIMGFALGLYVIDFEYSKYKTDPERTKKMLDAIVVIGSDDLDTVEMKRKKEKELNEYNKNTKSPDYRVSRNNPYGANSWLFKGIK